MNRGKIFDNLYHGLMVVMAAFIGQQITSKLEILSQTTQELNKNVAVLIERVANESHRVDKLDQEVASLKLKFGAK